MSDVNADKIPVPAQPEVLLHCLMDIAEALLAVGAEVNRVEDTLTRMGTAYGAVRMNAFVITSSIVVTMTLPSGRDITQTRRILTPGGTDAAPILFRWMSCAGKLPRSRQKPPSHCWSIWAARWPQEAAPCFSVVP